MSRDHDFELYTSVLQTAGIFFYGCCAGLISFRPWPHGNIFWPPLGRLQCLPWQLTKPVHLQVPADLLLSESRLTNETFLRRCSKFDKQNSLWVQNPSTLGCKTCFHINCKDVWFPLTPGCRGQGFSPRFYRRYCWPRDSTTYVVEPQQDQTHGFLI